MRARGQSTLRAQGPDGLTWAADVAEAEEEEDENGEIRCQKMRKTYRNDLLSMRNKTNWKGERLPERRRSSSPTPVNLEGGEREGLSEARDAQGRIALAHGRDLDHSGGRWQ